jgi:hypothetical protein
VASMSTSPNEGTDSQPPQGDDVPDRPEQRPQPRYGAYAPNSDAPKSAAPQGDGDSTAEPTHGAAESAAPQPGSPYNPYGEPTWGQSGGERHGGDTPGKWQSGAWQQGYQSPSGYPYGEQQSQPAWQYSDSPQQSSGYPPQTYAGAERPTRPGTLWGALAALLAAGVTALIWGIYVFVTLPTQSLEEVFGGEFSQMFAEQMERQSAQDPELQNLSTQEMEEVTLLGIGMIALVWGFVLLALYVAAAFLGSMAGNAGRIFATIWAGFSLLFFLLGYDGISYALILATVVLSIVAIVLMWLPSSSQYIRHRKWEREVSRGGYYGNPSPHS